MVDNIVEGGGLQVGTRYNSVPLAGTTTFARNVLLRTGSFDIYNPNSKGEGSIWVFSDNGPITQGSVIFEDILSFSVFLFFFECLQIFPSLILSIPLLCSTKDKWLD